MAVPSDNYYDVLHVSREAPLEIIRASYRTLMQKLKNHPDLGGDAATAAAINEAYAVLTDIERRAEYDAHLDVLAHVAEGIPDPVPEQEQAPVHARKLNPYRECLFCETPHEYGKNLEYDAACTVCSSPLCVAEYERLESTGQRGVERINKSQAITFFTHWPQQDGFIGQTEDISLNGMRFVTCHELQVGQRIKIVGDVLDAVATVTHTGQERRRWRTAVIAGVSFDTLRFARSVGGFVSKQV